MIVYIYGALHVIGAVLAFVIIMTAIHIHTVTSANKHAVEMADEVERATGFSYNEFNDDSNSEAVEAMMRFFAEHHSQSRWESRLSDLFGSFATLVTAIMSVTTIALPLVLVFVYEEAWLFWAMPLIAILTYSALYAIGNICFIVTGRHPGASKSRRALYRKYKETRGVKAHPTQ